MKVVYSPKCLAYSKPAHPESPKRIINIFEELRKDAKFEFIIPAPAAESDILSVHTRDLVDSVKTNSFADIDTPNIPDIFDFSLLAVGAAIKACEIAQEEKYAFSLSRPPGHHAGRNFLEGFCYFNNIAVAVTKLLKNKKRVAILDIDVHHGNGTQDIFLGKKAVWYASIHQTPLYPGTGLKSEKNCYNFPIPSGTGGEKYLNVLIKVLNQIKLFKSDFLAVSLGFDTYKEDPLAGIKLEINDYEEIGSEIRKINIPAFFVLEGGYSSTIGACAGSFFQGLLQ